MLLKGFRFGMLLQLAVGPVCIYIFSVGCNRGFISAETGVFAVTVVDALFVLFAIIGIASAIRNERTQKVFKIAGAIIVAYFGLSSISGVFDINIMPHLQLFGNRGSGNPFINGFLLTASNPLTILFWTGVFSTKIAEEKMSAYSIYLFGGGAILATLLFLSVIAVVGSLLKTIIPDSAVLIKVLNLLVGVSLVYFSITKLIGRGLIKGKAS